MVPVALDCPFLSTVKEVFFNADAAGSDCVDFLELHAAKRIPRTTDVVIFAVNGFIANEE